MFVTAILMTCFMAFMLIGFCL